MKIFLLLITIVLLIHRLKNLPSLKCNSKIEEALVGLDKIVQEYSIEKEDILTIVNVLHTIMQGICLVYFFATSSYFVTSGYLITILSILQLLTIVYYDVFVKKNEVMALKTGDITLYKQHIVFQFINAILDLVYYPIVLVGLFLI